MTPSVQVWIESAAGPLRSGTAYFTMARKNGVTQGLDRFAPIFSEGLTAVRG